MRDFQKIDWEKYNRPPFYQQWLCRDDTHKLATFGDQGLSEFDDQVLSLKDQWDLDTVTGHFLDRSGKLLNEARNGNTDAYYRILLKLRRLLNTNNGSIPSIIKAIKFLYSSEVVHIVPDYPAGLIIEHDGEGTPGLNFNKLLAEIIPAGVSFSTKELFDFFENILPITSSEKTGVIKNSQDLFPSGLRYNGRFLCDQGTVIICNGEWVCDGSINCEGVVSAIGTIFDYYLQELFCNGKWICNGDKDCSGFEKVYEDEFFQLPILPREYMRDELFISLRTEQEADTATVFHDLPMKIKIINPLICDGSKMPACSLCDGSIVCDGSYTGYDGRYYRDEITEEVL
jgi:hypothetical protein